MKASIESTDVTVVPSSGSQPVVSYVSASTANGAYKAGDVISVTVTFGLPATVTGTPRLLLETGTTDRYADYASGSGTDTLTFTYTVQAGDTSSDLAYVATNSLELNGGSISAGSTAMTLTLPALAALGSLDINKNLVIDTTAPVLGGAITDGAWFNSLTATPNLSFTSATDVGGSGISKYQIAIGTTAGGTDIVNWADATSLSIPYQHTGLTLTAGTTYYPSLRAVDSAGNVSAIIQGDGWIPDVTAPTSPATVNDGVSSYNTTGSPTITWTTSTDVGSGLARYELAIGTTAGGTDILNWTDIGSVTSYVRTGLTLSVGTSYYASIRAVDNAGNATTAQGDGWQVVACDTYGWCPQAYLKAPNADAWDGFGGSVAIDGDTAVVCAYGEASNQTTITNGATASLDNSLDDAGAVYVFKRNGTTWIQEAYIKAANANANDGFGISVSINRDTIAVGSTAEASNQTTITNGSTASSDNTYFYSGAVYVYKRTGSTWAQEAYIKPANNGSQMNFGSVDVDGDTLVVGSYGDDSEQTTITNGATASAGFMAPFSGAAFVYQRTGSSWAQQAYIKAPNADSNDYFGISVGISGDTIVVGSPFEDSNQTTITNGTTASSDNSASMVGAAYVFKRTGATWAQEAYIKAPNSGAGDWFGTGAVISGDTVAVGATLEDSNQTTITNGSSASSDNSAPSAGAVYVFKRTGTAWAQEAYIKAPNADANDNFGYSLALDGDSLAVGAYQECSNQSTITNGATANLDNSSTNSGAVYIFKRTGTTWMHEGFVKAANSGANDSFGDSVAISGDTVLVGADGEDSNQTTITNGITASADNSATGSGAAYVFNVKRQATWQQQAYVKAPNAEGSDWFGNSVDISEDTVIVGAYGEDSSLTTITNGATASADNGGNDSGAAYIFKRSGTNWTQEAYVKPPNTMANVKFGNAVAIDGDTAVVAAEQEWSNQTTITNGTTASSNISATWAGAAYIFKRTGVNWTQEAYVKASNAQAMDYFGTSVDVDGDTVVVGARGESSNQTTITNGTGSSADNSSSFSGAVYVYKRTGVNWVQEAYIKASNSAVGLSFGYNLSVSGDTLVVGAGGDSSNQTTITNGATSSSDTSASGSGAVFVYKRTGVNWVQEAYIKASNSEAGDGFGSDLALDRDTLVVSSAGEDSNQTTITNGSTASSDNSLSFSGAVYIFKRTGTTWAQEAYIKPPNPGSLDLFGNVSISGDTVVVGASNEDSNQTTITNGATASSDDSVADSGAVYVFKRTGVNWVQEAYIKAPNAEAGDNFGGAVAISRDTIAVGASAEDCSQTTITNGATASTDNSASASGAVYIFKR